MKQLAALLSVFVLMLVAFPTQAQTPQKVGDPTSYMTPEQLAKYSSDMKIADLEKRLETYGNWVGVGGEVGNAIEEGLTAVVDVADKFGKTDVGVFTMVLVAWKVVGKDVVRILLGLFFFALVTWLFLKVYKGYYRPKRTLTEKTPQGWFRRAKKVYTVTQPNRNWEGENAIPIVMLCLYAGMVGITYAIMFA